MPRDDQPDLARAMAVRTREAGGRAHLRAGRDRGRRGRGRPRSERCTNSESAGRSGEAGCHAADSSFAVPSMGDVEVVPLGVEIAQVMPRTSVNVVLAPDQSYLAR